MVSAIPVQPMALAGIHQRDRSLLKSASEYLRRESLPQQGSYLEN
ncbi:hypothetical protein [Nostoc flagelliforme]|nr:hypothetical protein [Nostoc flagelliforme]